MAAEAGIEAEAWVEAKAGKETKDARYVACPSLCLNPDTERSRSLPSPPNLHHPQLASQSEDNQESAQAALGL